MRYPHLNDDLASGACLMGSQHAQARTILLLIFIAAVCCSADAAAPEAKAPFPFPEAAPKEDWEWDKDERFDELMEQLAINEASLDAVKSNILKKTRRKGSQTAAANRFEDSNRLMDRKGGGPMKWDEFYGTNAEKFFYHPIDPNTTYHTVTALRQIGKYEDDKENAAVPSRQSLPVHQRPPQWDYIYRANESARERALEDASLAEGEIEGLQARQTQLEREQAILWCKLAFRAVQRLNMSRKPILRFTLTPPSDDARDTDRKGALEAAAQFLACALAVVEKAEEDQSAALGGVGSVVKDARDRFDDSLLETASLEPQWSDTNTGLGRFYRLSRLLADKAQTMAESYAGAIDGDIHNEAARKERFRGLLQNAVVDYAQILLALNEQIDSLKAEWKVRVDTTSKLAPLQLAWCRDEAPDPRQVEAVERSAGALQRDTEAKHKGGVVVDVKKLRRKFAASKVGFDVKSGVLTLGYDFTKAEQLGDWEPSQTPLERARRIKGIRIGPEDQLKHRAVFERGSCLFHFAVHEKQHRGDVAAAGTDVVVWHKENNGRVFRIGDRDTRTPGGFDFRVLLTAGDGRSALKVNNNELAVRKAPSMPFSFQLLGGENGTDFGSCEISGEPDASWFASVMGE